MGGKLRHLVPMVHQGVVGSYFLMAVGDVLVDECHRLLPAMELDAAIQVTGKSGKSFYPSVEARFKFGSRWYRHLYSADGIERLIGEPSITWARAWDGLSRVGIRVCSTFLFSQSLMLIS